MQNKTSNKIRRNFTICPNDLINDNSLSDRARFLFVYIASKPDDWNFYNAYLTKHLGYKSDTIRKYIKELIISGWIKRTPTRDEKGKFSGFIIE